ncbi:MAG TPA: NAD-dependent epimerase/dehydratase family protein [Acetobacteraceae bacterium]|nr:NAD-dependent epimerase/dehydratase family protein [Acetobacteraceae bacterium]
MRASWPSLATMAKFGTCCAPCSSRPVTASKPVMPTALQGSGRPLVTTFGTMGLATAALRATRPGTEDDAPAAGSPGIARAMTEETVEALASLGVRATMVRLAPSVHGDGDTGLVPQLITIVRKKANSAYIGDGGNRWTAVHRTDAARLFRLALESGIAGARYHGVAEEGISFRTIADVIGR